MMKMKEHSEDVFDELYDIKKQIKPCSNLELTIYNVKKRLLAATNKTTKVLTVEKENVTLDVAQPDTVQI